MVLFNAAISLATPITDNQSGLLGVGSVSNISCPNIDSNLVPFGTLGGKTSIPSWLSPIPSSFSEQIMPSDTTPLIFAACNGTNC